MDTPEGDISAIASGMMEPLPTYTAEDDGQHSFQALLATLQTPNDPQDSLDQNILDEINKSQNDGPEPIQSYPEPPFGRSPDLPMRARQSIINGFFVAISQSQYEGIALFLSERVVTANTTNEIGKTPFLEAIETRNIRLVKQLLEAGANPHEFGTTFKGWDFKARMMVETKRTPLMLAASIGHFAIVKLLIEDFHVDDALIAPDGQIALRLAAENGHREIVDYLPTRRGGGFLRWQTEHAKAIRRTEKALKKLYQFCKFFVWDIEKFFLWTVPKDCIVMPLKRRCNWCWEHRKGFGPWCAEQARQTPVRMKRFGKWVWKGVKKVPIAVKDASKEVWNIVTKDIPKLLKKLAIWCWSLVTRRIPHAIAILAKWIWGGISSAGKAVWDVVLKVVSLLHTALSAVLTFFQNLSLKDVWDGFCALLRSIFITFPQTLGRWIAAFGETSYKLMKTLFGGLGICIWFVIVGLGWLALYIPRKLWTVISSLGGSCATGLHEIKIWFSPKA